MSSKLKIILIFILSGICLVLSYVIFSEVSKSIKNFELNEFKRSVNSLFKFNPPTLYEQPRRKVHRNVQLMVKKDKPVEPVKVQIDESLVEFIERIFPNTFDKEKHTNKYVIVDELFSENETIKVMDLSNLKIQVIPEEIASRLTDVEELKVSPLDENKDYSKLIQHLPLSNIRKVSLGNSKTSKPSPKIFSWLKLLENLTELNISKFHNIQPLGDLNTFKNLVRLSMIDCSLSLDDLRIICENCKDLEYLDLSFNTNIFKDCLGTEESILLPSKLKCLNFSGCLYSLNNLLTLSVTSSFEELVINHSLFEAIQNSDIVDLFSSQEMNVPEESYKRLNLNQLKSISFKDCKICNHELANNLFNIPQLTKLDLSENNLIIDFSDLLSCKSFATLRELNISGLKSYKSPKDIGKEGVENPEKKKPIEYLNLEFFMDFLHKFKVLEVLDISGIKRGKDSNTLDLNDLSKTLIKLYANNCNLNGQCLLDVLKCEKLKFFEAANNNFKEIPEINEYKSSGSLEEIDVTLSNLNNVGLEFLLQETNLKKIAASYCDFSELTDSNLQKAKSPLKIIDVRDSQIKTEQLQILATHFALEELRADGNDFSEEIEGEIFGQSQSSLKTLELRTCSLNKHLIEEIQKKLSALKCLTLSKDSLAALKISQKDFKKSIKLHIR